LVDVRAFPVSRRHPHFSREHLGPALEAEQIRYDWQGRALGGFRQVGEHSAHTALKNPLFRAYADHMQSDAFAGAMTQLMDAAQNEAICLMCAESDPAHCHRSLIADWLVARGERVVHLRAADRQNEHTLSPLAVLEEEGLAYRGAQPKLL
jgi:uncharacterized protein (DUF488 family)